jgi:hypothetical protein
VAALLLLSACNGGSGSGGGGGNTPPPTQPPPTPTNPCQSAAALETDETFEPPRPSRPTSKRNVVDGDVRWRVLDELWKHRQAQLRRAREPQPRAEVDAPIGRPPVAADVGDIAVVQDEGDLVDPANAFDLHGVGLRFGRNNTGGYDVQRIDATFRQTLGARQTLTDDDSVAVEVPFPFPFYGRTQTMAFVNSDGNITFETEDKASTERNVARMLTGPPRVAPFFSDLDPTVAGGRIFVHAAADQYTVTWCGVRGFDSQLAATVQTTLLPDGVVEFKYGTFIPIPDAIVALSPGRTAVFTPVNLNDQGPTAGGAGGVGERFAERSELDTVEVIRKFYRTHADNYDQLIVWTDTPYTRRGTFAFESTVANDVRGIGVPIFDLSREFGSGGRLRSMAMMDAVAKYPADPATKFLGENNTLSILGQEVGHRWMAFVDFLDHTRQRSDALLGRGLSHWSFFLDSDASVMEGNDIEQQADGSFRTVAAVQRYSALDQYLMGLIPARDVPPFFYVESPMNTNPVRDRDDAPLVGATFVGTRREVRVEQDIVPVHGERIPSAENSPKVHRQAFIFMVTAGRTVDPAHIEKIDRIRREWETFFRQATSGRMTAITTVQ